MKIKLFVLFSEDSEQQGTLYNELVKNVDAKIFVEFLNKESFIGVIKNYLNGIGSFTVFAPTNEAFHQLDPKLMRELLGNEYFLASFLAYHIALGKIH